MSLTLEFFKRSTNITARVIADSISPLGKRITTLEIEYPRFILAELNTHKALEKNSSSSRAIPIMVMIEFLLKNGAQPLYWGTKQAGMQAGDEPDIRTIGQFMDVWDDAKGEAITSAIDLEKLGLHKQTANRLLEPFQMMKTVITGTDWDNFFNLRIHPDAQPEFCMLAYRMYMAMAESVPMQLKSGEWHLPYINTLRGVLAEDGESWDMNSEIIYCTGSIHDGNLSNPLTLEEAQRISASCCAQTSYRKSDDSLGKADDIFHKLVGADVLHASPFGHLATPVRTTKISRDSCFHLVDTELSVNSRVYTETWEEGITHMKRDGTLCSGNLTGWISYRHLIPNNTCYEFNFEERMKLFGGDLNG